MFDLGGIMHGLNRGFEYMAAVARLAVDGYHAGDQQKEQDALHVLNLWAQEVAATAGNPVGAAIGGDPFSGSRHAAEDVFKKYNITV